MPRAMYICPVCHKNVLASKAIHIKTRYYHKSCLDKKIKKEKEKIDNDKLTKKQREQYERALKQSALPKIPEAVPESEAQAAEKFFSKVEQIQGKCTAKSSAMAYKYKKMYEGFTWEGMEQTLEYCFSVITSICTNPSLGLCSFTLETTPIATVVFNANLLYTLSCIMANPFFSKNFRKFRYSLLSSKLIVGKSKNTITLINL